MYSKRNHPVNGRHAVLGTATPLTQVTTTSGTPTYTNKRVTDSIAWDLSNVDIDMVVEVEEASGEKYFGVVSLVDDGNDYVEVQGWYRGGVSGQGKAEMKPTDGRTATIHKIDACVRLIIDALDANTVDAFVGFDSDVTVSGADAGHPIAADEANPNHRFVAVAGLAKFIDLTQVYVIGTAGNALSWVAM